MLIVLTFKVQQEKATVRKTSFKKHRDNSYDKFEQFSKTTALLGTDSSIFQEYSQGPSLFGLLQWSFLCCYGNWP